MLPRITTEKIVCHLFAADFVHVALFNHFVTDSLRDEVDAFDVDARDFVVNFFVEFVFAVRIFRVDEQAGNVDTRVVDEDVNLAESVERSLENFRPNIAKDASTSYNISDSNQLISRRGVFAFSL